MRSIAFPALLVIGCYLAVANCEDHFSKDYSNSLNDLLEPSNNEIEDENINNNKRGEKYTYGLGRRAYSYTAGGNGIKRLPIYNFGLGKRARPYNFGLGKRSDDIEDVYSDILDSSETIYPGNVGAGGGDNNNNFEAMEKRARPYNFGLGKRLSGGNTMSRRAILQRYNFGLGKR